MATAAQFVTQPLLDLTIVNTANTARDGTGTLATIASGPAAAAASGVGERINRVVVQANQTTTAGVIRFFLSVDGGTTKRLILEKLVPAITPSTTVAAFRIEVPELVGMVLPGGGVANLYASTNAGETFSIYVESGQL